MFEEDKLPAGLLFGFCLEREKILLASRVRRVIWLMVAEHEEDGSVFRQLFAKKLDEPGVLGVANVHEQRKVLRYRGDVEDIVRRWRLQM